MTIRGSGRNVENRKMFSHREHGFPTAGGDAEDKDWLGRERIILENKLRRFSLEMDRGHSPFIPHVCR
jgi:hypothetical protein